MKKIFILSLAFVLMCGNVYASNQWRAGLTSASTPGQTIPGTTLISDIDTVSYQNIVDPLDRVLSGYIRGCKMVYSSVSQLTVEAGELFASDSTGVIRLALKNASSTTVTWADIDSGTEAIGTYYVYGGTTSTTASAITFKISLSSTVPTGLTYFKRIGSFYNNGSGNISNLVNDSYQMDFRAIESKAEDTTFQALTDGYFIGVIKMASGEPMGHSITGLVDGSSPPVSELGYASISSASNASSQARALKNSFCIPVLKGNYYKGTYSDDGSNGTATRVFYWVPVA